MDDFVTYFLSVTFCAIVVQTPVTVHVPDDVKSTNWETITNRGLTVPQAQCTVSRARHPLAY